MKVFQINCGENGSIGQIMTAIENALDTRADQSYVFYGLGKKSTIPNHKKITLKYENGINKRINYISGYRFGFAPIATFRLLLAIELNQPDIVHIHCVNGYMLNVYQLIAYITKRNIPLVVTNHCEMFYTGNCDHSYDCMKWAGGCGGCEYLRNYLGPFRVDRTAQSWKKMYASYKNIDNVAITSVSKWVYERSIESPITNRFFNTIIENGIDLDNYDFDQGYLRELADRYKIEEDKKHVLFVTAHFKNDALDNKGGYYFVKLAEQFIHDDSLRFVIVGSTGEETCFPPNVINIGRVEDRKELMGLYCLASISIVLSRRETFSMPCVESLCAGTPVVGFKSNGPESISLEQYSEFCEYGKLEELKRLLEKWITYKMNHTSEIIRTARDKYNSEIMTHKYLDLYDSLIEKKRSNNQGKEKGSNV